MKKASVRELRYAFNKIERLLDQGEEVQITKAAAGDCPPGPGKQSGQFPDA